MGKSGELLRAKKRQQVFTFTLEQLEARDRATIAARKAVLEQKVQEEMDARLKLQEEIIRKEWAEREEHFKTGDREEDFYMLLQYMLSIPARVLIEHFNFPPIYKNYKSKTTKFMELCADELGKISGDEMMDIRKYCDEVFEKYGVKFQFGEEE